MESPGDLKKDDIADDLEWSLKVISGSVNGFIASKIEHIYCTKSITTVEHCMSAILSTVIFHCKDFYMMLNVIC